MNRILAAVPLAMCTTFPTAQTSSPAQTAVLATVHKFVGGFNQGDAQAIVATCAEEATILDDFPPHEWHGSGACSKWFTDFQTMAKSDEIAGASITVGKPWHVSITGEFAYVVAPVGLTFQRKGKPARDSGILTMTLRKDAAGWRTTGWAWSDR